MYVKVNFIYFYLLFCIDTKGFSSRSYVRGVYLYPCTEVNCLCICKKQGAVSVALLNVLVELNELQQETLDQKLYKQDISNFLWPNDCCGFSKYSFSTVTSIVGFHVYTLGRSCEAWTTAKYVLLINLLHQLLIQFWAVLKVVQGMAHFLENVKSKL